MSYAQAHFQYRPPFDAITSQITHDPTWNPELKLIVLANRCYYATGTGDQQTCPEGFPYNPGS